MANKAGELAGKIISAFSATLRVLCVKKLFNAEGRRDTQRTRRISSKFSRLLFLTAFGSLSFPKRYRTFTGSL